VGEPHSIQHLAVPGPVSGPEPGSRSPVPDDGPAATTMTTVRPLRMALGAGVAGGWGSRGMPQSWATSEPTGQRGGRGFGIPGPASGVRDGGHGPAPGGFVGWLVNRRPKNRALTLDLWDRLYCTYSAENSVSSTGTISPWASQA
jgi:hypothetical protein